MEGHQRQRLRTLPGVFTVLGLSAMLALASALPSACGREPSTMPDFSGLFYYEEGSRIPRLTAEGKARAKEIALNDRRVMGMLEGKNYAVAQQYGDTAVNTRIGIWHASEDLRVMGAALEIWFDKPYTIEWVGPSPYLGGTIPGKRQVRALMVMVSFAQGKVVEILDFGG